VEKAGAVDGDEDATIFVKVAALDVNGIGTGEKLKKTVACGKGFFLFFLTDDLGQMAWLTDLGSIVSQTATSPLDPFFSILKDGGEGVTIINTTGHGLEGLATKRKVIDLLWRGWTKCHSITTVQ